MKTRNKVMIAAALTVAMGSVAVTGLSIAHDRGDSGRDDKHHDGQRDGRHGHKQHRHGHKQHRHGDHNRHFGARRMHREKLLQRFDSNNDGSLTQDEINQARTERFKTFDQDNDGQLNLQEYQLLWLDAERSRMVDRFQELDDDGDAAVTAEEFQAPVRQLMSHTDSDDDSAISDDEVQ